MSKRVVGIAAASVILATFNVGPALPCLCSGREASGRDALPKYAAVFVGYTTNIIRLVRTEGTVIERFDDPVVVKFSVSRAWKGVNQESVTVEMAAHGGACGDMFSVGQSYLVYARQQAPGYVLKTDTCTPTKALQLARQEINSLGRPIFLVEHKVKQ